MRVHLKRKHAIGCRRRDRAIGLQGGWPGAGVKGDEASPRGVRRYLETAAVAQALHKQTARCQGQIYTVLTHTFGIKYCFPNIAR